MVYHVAIFVRSNHNRDFQYIFNNHKVKLSACPLVSGLNMDHDTPGGHTGPESFNYTGAFAVTDMAVDETFRICKEICSEVKNSKVENIIEDMHRIRGNINRKFAVDHKYVIEVVAVKNKTLIVVNYSTISLKGKPIIKDFITPFLDLAFKRIPIEKNEAEIQIRLARKTDFYNFFGKTMGTFVG